MFRNAALSALLMLTLASAHAQQAAVRIEAPWVRATVEGQPSAGVFMTLRSAAADRLLGGSSTAAEAVEVHSMKMDGNVMRMAPVAALDLPASKTVALKPGGYHLMLQGLKAPLRAGSQIPVTLRFAKAGEIRISVPVQAMTASAPPAASPHHNH